jgi:hypothetical protein
MISEHGMYTFGIALASLWRALGTPLASLWHAFVTLGLTIASRLLLLPALAHSAQVQVDQRIAARHGSVQGLSEPRFFCRAPKS